MTTDHASDSEVHPSQARHGLVRLLARRSARDWLAMVTSEACENVSDTTPDPKLEGPGHD